MAGKMPAPHKVGNLSAGHLDKAPTKYRLPLNQLCRIDDSAPIQRVEPGQAGIGGGAAQVFDQVPLGTKGGFASHFPVFGQCQGNYAGDKGGSHRGAAESGVTARRIAGGDLIAWSHDIDLATSR